MMTTLKNHPALAQMVSQFRDVARFDHSVSVPELGSLFYFNEANALGQMQQGIANIYQSPFAYLTTNGTTSLNVLALMAVAQPGDTVLCQRDSHVSIFAPMILTGLEPVYVEPTFDPGLGINLGVTSTQLQQALRANPEVKAVFLTYPNYFGIATDINACARIVAQRNIPLIIDSAHGAHFGFHPGFPLPAHQTNAAIVTQSTHKTCTALSQGSLALFNDLSLVSRFYELVNQLGFISTSFSYIILASVVMAVLQLHEHGSDLLEHALGVAGKVRQGINDIEGLFCFGLESRRAGFVAFDPLRVTVDVSRLGVTGFAVEQLLIDEFQIYPEMATLQHVLFLFTHADDMAGGQRVIQSLQQIAGRFNIVESLPTPPSPPTPPQHYPPRPVFFHRQKQAVPVSKSIGATSAETIACYPPGSAVIVAGEEITPEIIAFLTETRRRGGVLKGASDPNFQTIKVLA